MLTKQDMHWCAVDCCDGVTVHDEASHWMPLPATPEQVIKETK